MSHVSPVSWRLMCNPRGKAAPRLAGSTALEEPQSQERGWDVDERNRFLLW